MSQFQKVKGFCREDKRDRDLESVQTLSEWRNLHDPFWLKPFSLELSVFVNTGLGVWFVVCLCCCRDPSDCLPPVCCCRDSGDCLSLVRV